MGTYKLTEWEIAKALDRTLDGLEGDFTEEQLLNVLERMKLYPFVCDKATSIPKYVRAGMKLEGGERTCLKD